MMKLKIQNKEELREKVGKAVDNLLGIFWDADSYKMDDEIYPDTEPEEIKRNIITLLSDKGSREIIFDALELVYEIFEGKGTICGDVFKGEYILRKFENNKTVTDGEIIWLRISFGIIESLLYQLKSDLDKSE